MANEAKMRHTKLIHQVKLADANKKGMSTAEIQIWCECPHRDESGALDLAPPKAGGEKDKYTGAPLYRCRTCRRLIDLSPVPSDSFEKDLSEINRVIDVAKMRLDFKSERDMDILDDLSAFQYKANTMLRDVYNSLSKQGKKKKKESKSPWAGMTRVR